MKLAHALLAMAPAAFAQHSAQHSNANYDGELWTFDQADSSSAGGGALYVANLEGDIQASYDFNTLTAEAGCGQNKRAHMGTPFPNSAATTEHVFITSIASANIQAIDTKTKKIVGCITFGAGVAGHPVNVHHTVVHPSGKYALAFFIGAPGIVYKYSINKNGDGTLALKETGGLTLTAEKYPILAPSKMICGLYNEATDSFYVTLADGGLVVLRAEGDVPEVVAQFSKEQVPGTGCSLDALPDGSLVTGGASKTGDNYLFHWPAATTQEPYPPPSMTKIAIGGDIHSTFQCMSKTGAQNTWVAERLKSGFTVIDLYTGKSHVVPLGEWNGVTVLPDISTFKVNLKDDSTAGRAFVALRGPAPLTAITEVKHPDRVSGWAVLDISPDCMSITNTKYVKAEGVVTTPNSDVHGLTMVRFGSCATDQDCPDNFKCECAGPRRRLLFGGAMPERQQCYCR